MWVLVVLLVGYGSNGNRLRVWEKVDWMIYVSCNTPIFWIWAIKNQWLRVLFSLPILWGRRERLDQCQSSQGCRALWSPGAVWIGEIPEVGETCLVLIVGTIVCKKRKVKNCWYLETVSVSGDCKDNFVNK